MVNEMIFSITGGLNTGYHFQVTSGDLDENFYLKDIRNSEIFCLACNEFAVWNREMCTVHLY